MARPHVIIIGAGFTGCATAHDLALRGCDVTVVERGEIASGTSGRTHGLLHSGGRYCVSDHESAVECIEEDRILREIAGQCIEPNGGLFIALDNSDLSYADSWLKGAAACNIPVTELTPFRALELEPHVNPRLKAAFTVPDGTFDPLRLAFAFAATAVGNGATFKTYTEVEDVLIDGQGRVTGVRVWDRANDVRAEIHGDMVVSATGAWAGRIADMVGAAVPIAPTPGVMVAYERRLTQRPINRLNVPGDGDIAIPQRRMIIVGTTSFEAHDFDYVEVKKDQIDLMRERGAELIPELAHTAQRGAFVATRPLIADHGTGRSLARTFKCFDHKVTDGIDGMVTITGGKATTCRAMAEKTADVVCAKLGITAVCTTRTTPLRSYRRFWQAPQPRHIAEERRPRRLVGALRWGSRP